MLNITVQLEAFFFKLLRSKNGEYNICRSVEKYRTVCLYRRLAGFRLHHQLIVNEEKYAELLSINL